jgi:AcrR family transcriptional regulator
VVIRPVVQPAAGIRRTRDGLVAGAARAFADHGLRGCTMQAVAVAAGVSKATLYNHFRTKDQLAWDLVAVELERLTGLAGDLPPAQALAALADELGEHPVLRRIAAAEPDVFAGLLDLPSDLWAGLTGRLAAALSTDDDGAELAARWLLGVVLQPGRSSLRHRSAARLAAVLQRGYGGQIGRGGRSPATMGADEESGARTAPEQEEPCPIRS